MIRFFLPSHSGRSRPVVAACALAIFPSLTNCTSYSEVRAVEPKYIPITASGGAHSAVETEFINAGKAFRRSPVAALGGYVDVADSALRQLDRNPNDLQARNNYNFAVARIISTIQKAKLDPWSQPLRVPSASGEFILTRKPDPRPQRNPALYDFTPADQFNLGGSYVSNRTVKEGLGAPVVAVGKNLRENAKEDFAMQRIYYGVTAVARFKGRHCEIDFEDPLATETVRLDDHTYPLAADFTVPLAVMLASNDPKKLELARLLNPEKYAETAKIMALQPYDPNKTVVLVIHGLMDSQATWTPMINSLRGDPEIRKNYQFWFYSYPSGYPYPYSASILRKELDAIEARYKVKKPIVVIGHSMGGCISRLMITDTNGNELWMKLFGKSPDQITLSADNKRLFEDALIFKQRREIGRVIFISAPLKGSDLADNWMGRLGSKLVHAPTSLLKASADIAGLITFQAGDLKLKGIPNSVDTLSPTNRFVKTINTMPLAPGIPYHVIGGDRGKGGNKDHTRPVMSDGVVPYWSYHMDGAQSEKIVPSGHSAHQNEQAIQEVDRILKLNLKN